MHLSLLPTSYHLDKNLKLYLCSFDKVNPEKELNLIKNIIKIARDVLINESQAILNLTNFIDNDFEACVRDIFASKGRVVITGIGKSAIIANKIVATLNSTG